MLHASGRRMLLSPKHLPRLTAIVGLFTRYGLRDVARQQGLLSLGVDEDDSRQMKSPSVRVTRWPSASVSSSWGLRT
jgi:hypothetical protein